MYIHGNVTLTVQDFDAAVRYYTDTLGFDLKARFGNDWAEVAVAGLTVGLHPAYEGAPTGTGIGKAAVGLEVADIAAGVTALQAKGVAFTTDIQDNGFLKIAHFADPEGNPLYLTQVAGGQ